MGISASKTSRGSGIQVGVAAVAVEDMIGIVNTNGSNALGSSDPGGPRN